MSCRVCFRVVTSQRSMRCQRLSQLYVMGRVGGGGTFWRLLGVDCRFYVTLVRCVLVTSTISSSRLKVAVSYITLLAEYRHVALLCPASLTTKT